MPTVWLVVGLGFAYVMGSIPMGYWLAKACKDLDIRQHGSGNIGASNVGRILGKPWGIAVLIFDIAKGAVPVILGRNYFYPLQGSAWISSDLYCTLCGIAAVCGHNWTMFLGFKGGKGVATSAGAVLGVAPAVAIPSILIWAAAAKISGYISVASISGALAFCAFTFVLKTSTEIKILGFLLAGMILAKHRSNIQRLCQGTEPKIGKGPKAGDGHVVR